LVCANHKCKETDTQQVCALAADEGMGTADGRRMIKKTTRFHPNRATLRIAMASERTGHNATVDGQRRAQADKTSETLGFSINYL